MTPAVDRRDSMDSVWAIKHGLIGGVIAGVVFLIAEMIGSVLLGGELLAPFQAFASIPLGQMPPEIAIGTAIPVGFVTHFVLSIIYGVIFALIVMVVPAMRASSNMLIAAATIFGTLLWIVNFFVLPSVIGRPWFATAPMIPQFVYHAFFYGTVLGLYFASRSRLADH